MEWKSVKETALSWGISERSVRDYCAKGRIPNAELIGKTWRIPADTVKPERKNARRRGLLDTLRREKAAGVRGGIYHRVQVDLAYNSNHMEGSTLTHDQTRLIYETHTVGVDAGVLNVDDIIETVNHFRCFDMIVDQASNELSMRLIKNLHRTLKAGTSDAANSWFAVGEFKRIPNEVGGRETTLPERVDEELRSLLQEYNQMGSHTLEDIVAFHVQFERIHPFQDGNGRVGRLILFKECLRFGIIPLILSDDMRFYYYRGLAAWDEERGFLMGTCLSAQDRFRALLEYFRVDS